MGLLVSLLFLAQAGPSLDQQIRAGLAALSENRLEQARQQLETASQAQPENALVWVGLAQTYGRLQQKDAALKAAAEAERLAAGNAAIDHALALFYAGMGDFAHAAGCESRFAQSDSSDADAPQRAASLWLKAGQPEQARQQFAAALARQPANETYRFALVELLLKNQDFSTALSVLEAQPRQLETSAQLQLAYGVALYGQRKFEAAIDAFLKTVALDPTAPQPFVFLGKLLDQAGSRLAAIKTVFEQNLQRHPDDFMSLFLVARMELFLNPTSGRGDALLRASIAKDPDFWESRIELGQLLLRRREYTAAVEQLTRAVALAPGQASPHFHLARAYDRLGQPERAAAERARHQELTNAATP